MTPWKVAKRRGYRPSARLMGRITGRFGYLRKWRTWRRTTKSRREWKGGQHTQVRGSVTRAKNWDTKRATKVKAHEGERLRAAVGMKYAYAGVGLGTRQRVRKAGRRGRTRKRVRGGTHAQPETTRGQGRPSARGSRERRVDQRRARVGRAGTRGEARKRIEGGKVARVQGGSVGSAKQAGSGMEGERSPSPSASQARQVVTHRGRVRRPGERRWVTDEGARERAHAMRREDVETRAKRRREERGVEGSVLRFKAPSVRSAKRVPGYREVDYRRGLVYVRRVPRREEVTRLRPRAVTLDAWKK